MFSAELILKKLHLYNILEEELKRIDAIQNHAHFKTSPFDPNTQKKIVQETKVEQNNESENESSSHNNLFDSCFDDVEELVFPDIQPGVNTKLSEVLTGIKKAKERNAYEATQCQQVAKESKYFGSNRKRNKKKSEKLNNSELKEPENGSNLKSVKCKKSSKKCNKQQERRSKPSSSNNSNNTDEEYGNKNMHEEKHLNIESESGVGSEDPSSDEGPTEAIKQLNKSDGDVIIATSLQEGSNGDCTNEKMCIRDR